MKLFFDELNCSTIRIPAEWEPHSFDRATSSRWSALTRGIAFISTRGMVNDDAVGTWADRPSCHGDADCAFQGL
jgi:outer membrane protease